MKKPELNVVPISKEQPDFSKFLSVVEEMAKKYKTENMIVTLLSNDGDIVVVKRGLNLWETIGCLERAKQAVYDDVYEQV